MRVHLQTALVAALTIAGSAAPAIAQEAPGVQPILAVTARSVNADGSIGAEAGGSDPLVAGKSATHYLHAGRAGQEGLCSSGSSDGTVRGLDDLLKTAAHVWKVTTTGVGYENGRQTFDLEWARYAAASGAVPVASRTQRLTLAQDQTYTVDLLHNSGGSCRTAAIVLELEARAQEDPALADTVLHYDLWLVRRDAAGRKESRHFVLTGAQGAPVPFAFTPLRSEVPRLQGNQYTFSVLTSVAGRLRGRAQVNGRFSIELDTARQDRLHRDGQPAAANGRGTGRKMLDVGAGEAVEIELPARSGSTAIAASASDAAAARGVSGRVSAGSGGPPRATDPVLIRDGRLVVNFGPFFANETVSLIVQVRKAEHAER